MASGLFGFLGYDMVRDMERLPDENPDPLGLPDAIMVRPTMICIFDRLEDNVTLVTPVWPQPGVSARAAYEAAQERLADAVSDFERAAALPPRRRRVALDDLPEPQANMSKDDFKTMVETCKEYIRAGDVFQIVPSQRFSLPFALPPFALYRALRRINPSPFLYLLRLRRLRARRLAAPRSWCACATAGHHPAARRHRAGAARRPRRTRRSRTSCWPIPRSGPST